MGRTPLVKFVTTAGVYTPKSSYRVIIHLTIFIKCVAPIRGDEASPRKRVDPESFYNSGTLWAFHAQALAWMVATGLIIGEIMFKVYSGSRVLSQVNPSACK